MDTKKTKGAMGYCKWVIVATLAAASLAGCTMTPYARFQNVRAHPSRTCMSLSHELESPSMIAHLDAFLSKHKWFTSSVESVDLMAASAKVDGSDYDQDPALDCPATLRLANGGTLDGYFSAYYHLSYDLTLGALSPTIFWYTNIKEVHKHRKIFGWYSVKSSAQEARLARPVCLAPSTLATAKPLITAQIIHMGQSFGRSRRQIENGLSLSLVNGFTIPQGDGLPETTCFFKAFLNGRLVYIPTVKIKKSAYGGTYVEVSGS